MRIVLFLRYRMDTCMGSQPTNRKLLESSRDLEDRIASALQSTNTGQGCHRAVVGIAAAPLYLQRQAPATQCCFATAAQRTQRCANRPLSGQVATRRLAATPIQPRQTSRTRKQSAELFSSCDFPLAPSVCVRAIWRGFFFSASLPPFSP